MIGLVLVVDRCCSSRSSATSSAPMDPKPCQTTSFAAPDTIAFQSSDVARSFSPDAQHLPDHRRRSARSGNLPADRRARLRAPRRRSASSSRVTASTVLWLDPPPTSTSSAPTNGQPVHFLGNDKLGRDILSARHHRLAHLVDDCVGCGPADDHDRDIGRHNVRVPRGPPRRLGPALSVELILALLPQLPLYLALDDADPRHRAVQHLHQLFVIGVMALLGWPSSVIAKCAARPWR